MKVLGLAFLAAWNPKLLAVDVILMGTRRPRPMFACFLLGGMGLALTIGLLDVFVLHADAITTQGSASAGLDLALGAVLLVIGLLLATGHLHRRRRRQAQVREGPPPNRDSWAQRILREPRYGLAVLVGALAGTRARSISPPCTHWSTGHCPRPHKPSPWLGLSSSNSRW